MARPRKFTLLNAAGDEMQLDEHRTTGIATINPKGLGIGFENTVENFSTAQIIKARRAVLPDFEVDIVLGMNWSKQTTRQLFMNLVRFFDASPYVLKYENDNGVFYKDVELKDMPLTDLKESQLIQETFKFTQKGLWYQDVVFVGQDPIEPRTDAEGAVYRQKDKLGATDPDKLGRAYDVKGKRMDEPYYNDPTPKDYVEGYVMSSNASSTAQAGVFDLHNDSIYFGLQDSSPLEVIVQGQGEKGFPDTIMKNPWWEIVNTDGVVIASDAYVTDLLAIEQLVVVAGFGRNDAYIVNLNTGQRRPAYQLQDHTKTNFLMAPIGDSQLRFHTTNATNISADSVKLTMRKEYVAVG